MHRRHGDILVGNGEGIVRRGGRALERHTRRGPLLEGNGRIVITLLFTGLDAHRVARKEVSVVLCIGDDTGTGEIAIHDRHRIGLALAVRGVAVGRILIDRVGAGGDTRFSLEGTAGVIVIVGDSFPLDLHIANLGQGRSSHRKNTEAVSIILILTGVCHVDHNRAVGVDDHILGCIQTVAVITACRIVRRSTGDVH